MNFKIDLFSRIGIMSSKTIQLKISEESDYKDFNTMWCIPLKGMSITMEPTLLIVFERKCFARQKINFPSGK